jgi:hypothetical protein
MRNYVYLQLQKFTDKKLGDSESSFLPLKCAKTHLHALAISKIFPGIIHRIPIKMGEGGIGREMWDEEGRGTKGKGRGSCVPNDFSFSCAAPMGVLGPRGINQKDANCSYCHFTKLSQTILNQAESFLSFAFFYRYFLKMLSGLLYSEACSSGLCHSQGWLRLISNPEVHEF